ncbi:hypothetical protein U8V72_20050 [Priestia filamentosa]|uniref:hypothetical protein n=1 Tax=Priestia filamentosa TaxID=1402861 RepID=UPI00397C15F3
MQLSFKTTEEIRNFIHANKSGMYYAKNEDGELVSIYLEKGKGMKKETYQLNGWLLVQDYDEDGINRGHDYKGRHTEKYLKFEDYDIEHKGFWNYGYKYWLVEQTVNGKDKLESKALVTTNELEEVIKKVQEIYDKIGDNITFVENKSYKQHRELFKAKKVDVNEFKFFLKD